MNARAHDIARRRAPRIEAVLRQAIADNVAVGHHADELIVLSDGNGANVVLTHELRDLDERRFRADPLDALVHHFFDFHGGPPLLGAAMPQPGPNPYSSSIYQVGLGDSRIASRFRAVNGNSPGRPEFQVPSARWQILFSVERLYIGALERAHLDE